MKKGSNPGDRKRSEGSQASRTQAVAYARVSSKEQEREGYSIPQQLKLLREYAAANGVEIVRTFEDAETAKSAGRTAVGEMLRVLKQTPECRVILVEKTDCRVPRDLVTVA